MKALDETFERATIEIARSLWPKGWYRSSDAPKTLDAMIAFYRAQGCLMVSSLHSDHTVFSTPEVNYAFRAWHDWHHIRLNAEFDRAGEQAVQDAMSFDLWNWWEPNYNHQCHEYKRASAVLNCENIGQLDYWERFGAPPEDQRAFACGYLAARGLL